ncbi:MAG: uroporphyrinogen-III synthase, partial [Alphaproteobacteria bacterium]
GRHVGMQVYPDAPGTLLDFLVQAGAQPDPILCYRYALQEEDARVADIIRAMAAGGADLIAFTSAAQVRRLRAVAEATGLQADLDRAMTAVRVAAVGPVTAAAVQAAGWPLAAPPPDSFHLKPFTQRIVRLLQEDRAPSAS